MKSRMDINRSWENGKQHSITTPHNTTQGLKVARQHTHRKEIYTYQILRQHQLTTIRINSQNRPVKPGKLSYPVWSPLLVFAKSDFSSLSFPTEGGRDTILRTLHLPSLQSRGRRWRWRDVRRPGRGSSSSSCCRGCLFFPVTLLKQRWWTTVVNNSGKQRWIVDQ